MFLCIFIHFAFVSSVILKLIYYSTIYITFQDTCLNFIPQVTVW